MPAVRRNSLAARGAPVAARAARALAIFRRTLAVFAPAARLRAVGAVGAGIVRIARLAVAVRTLAGHFVCAPRCIRSFQLNPTILRVYADIP